MIDSNYQIIIDGFLEQYRNTSVGNFPGFGGAEFKDIPIEYLDSVRRYFKEQGVKIRVRYRGPRNNPLDTRPYVNRMQDCLRRFATRFSVYLEY